MVCKIFHRLLRFALWGFAATVVLIGVILLCTLPPLKCPDGCYSGGCSKNIPGTGDYVCTCPSGIEGEEGDCRYKRWTPQAQQQFYAALVLLIPTVIIMCMFCCVHCATSDRLKRVRKQLVRPTVPPPPTSIAPPPPPPEDDDEEAQNHNNNDEGAEHSDEEQEELDIPTHQTPAEISVRSLRSEIPLACLSKDTSVLTEKEESSLQVALAINGEFLDQNCFSEGSNPAYIEAVVLGAFGADEEIDEMAEYREANEEAEQRLQQQQ